MKKNNTNYIFIFSILTAFVSAVTLVFRSVGNSYFGGAVFLLQQMVYMGMITIWGMAQEQRILDAGLKKSMRVTTVLCLLWLLLRASRYRFFDGYETMERYLWYMYYIPMLFIPAEFFGISLKISGYRREKRVKNIVFVLSGVLALGILTNDFHGLAFKFAGDGNYNHYSHGIVYFMAVADIVFCLAGGIFILMGNRRRYRPFIWLLVLGVYCLLYTIRPGFLAEYHILNLPEAMCLIFLGIIESCISSGLILTNTDYPVIFGALSVPAVIVDEDGKQVYTSAEKIVRDEDHAVHERSLTGGKILWTEDLSEINKLTRALSEISDELAGENELLEAENHLEEEKVRLSEQDRIYDEIDALTGGQRGKIHKLLEGLTVDAPDYRQRMAQACVYGAYIKRRANLALLSVAGDMSVKELVLSIRETGNYLSLNDVTFGMDSKSGEEKLPAGDICLAYDFFEGLIEENMEGLSAVMVNILPGPDLNIRFTFERAGGFKAPDKWDRGLYVLVQDEETAYVTFVGRGCL